MHEAYDYVVVGGGTAGAVVAARLCQRSSASVCLLEAGPGGRDVPGIRDMRRWEALLGSEYDFDFAIEPEAGGNAQLRYAAGRVLGGSSALNTSFAFVAPDSDLRGWERRGATGWGPEGTREAFARVRRALPAQVTATPHPASRAFLEAAHEAGHPLVEHGGTELRAGAGWMPLSARGTRRTSSADAYLHPLARRAPGLSLRLATPARRIVIDGNGRAVGLEAGDSTIGAREEVIVCCGAINTPKLLMLSGIGPAEELTALGLDVRLDAPEVGRNLADHPLPVVTWAAERSAGPSAVHGWETGVLAASRPGLAEPDLFLMFATAPYDFETRRHGYPTAAEGFSIAPFPMRPRSTGSVRLASADPADAPAIRPGFFSDPEGHDAGTVRAGLELARGIAAQPALRPWLGRELAPGAGVRGDALVPYLRRTAGTMFHPAGSCRMGSDPSAVVGPDLRVRGLEGLRVADASVFPALVSVTPYLTCLMVGEKCADLVLAATAAGPVAA
jgi:choline dehydrogenase-like flavoprotein